MIPDYEGLVEFMKADKKIPLVIFYGQETEKGVDLNWFFTPAFDDADEKLKQDVRDHVKKIQL